ncbi:MAG: hypothetical protein JXB36_16585 [Gammaproteobacteria bacterium]|nr:hypothetical protein [Gammaproteobacteria bacterium]
MKKQRYLQRDRLCGALLLAGLTSFALPVGAQDEQGQQQAGQQPQQQAGQQPAPQPAGRQQAPQPASEQQPQQQAGQQPQQQAQQQQAPQQDEGGNLFARADPSPYAVPDGSFVSISGTVRSVESDAFTLDFGGNTITVEMDDRDRDAGGYQLEQGDGVTVYGLIDDDFFQRRTIEASSVFVEDLATYFYASAVDEEDRGFVAVMTPVDPSDVMLQGTVTAVDDEEFTLDSGSRSVTVEVEEMANNPLDDDGYQRIAVGDVVSVTGEVDDDFLEGREVEAESVTTIHDFN